jgi:hypothetical protein
MLIIPKDITCFSNSSQDKGIYFRHMWLYIISIVFIFCFELRAYKQNSVM